MQHQFRRIRRLVGIVDAGEVLDQTGAGFLVQALRIALLGFRERHFDIDLDEIHAAIDMQLAHDIAIGTVRRDEARQHDHAGVDEQLGDLADAADVLGAIFGREAEVLVDAEADVVAVEPVYEMAATVQHFFERDRDGALAAAGKAREPDRRALLLQELAALLAGHFAFVPGHIRCDLLRHRRRPVAGVAKARRARRGGHGRGWRGVRLIRSGSTLPSRRILVYFLVSFW